MNGTISTTWKATYKIFTKNGARTRYQTITGVSNEAAAKARFELLTGFSPSIIFRLSKI